MHYDFDAVIDRRGTGSQKWDGASKKFGDGDVLPLWVADMDFVSPAPVVEALLERARHGVFGYVERPDEFYAAIAAWLGRRHGFSVRPEHIVNSPGVVPALHLMVRAFTKPGDRVLIQTPVYPPFMRVAQAEGREAVYNLLVRGPNGYEMDFDALERQLDGVSLAILCNPHNPVGRVWTRDELARFGELCLRTGTLVASDEIHCDLTLFGQRHTPFASVAPELAARSLTCVAPSKTFNVPGLTTANVIIADDGLRREFTRVLNSLALYEANVFGVTALTAAYERGDEWLDQLLQYLQGNVEAMEAFLRAELPGVRMTRPEATYLAWLDFSSWGMTDEQLATFLSEQAHVGLNDGPSFGPGGSGFARLNFGCPRSTLKDGLSRIAAAARSESSVD